MLFKEKKKEAKLLIRKLTQGRAYFEVGKLASYGYPDLGTIESIKWVDQYLYEHDIMRYDIYVRKQDGDNGEVTMKWKTIHGDVNLEYDLS